MRRKKKIRKGLGRITFAKLSIFVLVAMLYVGEWKTPPII